MSKSALSDIVELRGYHINSIIAIAIAVASGNCWCLSVVILVAALPGIVIGGAIIARSLVHDHGIQGQTVRRSSGIHLKARPDLGEVINASVIHQCRRPLWIHFHIKFRQIDDLKFIDR